MVDRIDIGVGPRISYDEPTDTSGFKYTGQETVSADQYGSQFVDFYSQSLDIPSLSEQTGIDPTAPGVGEDIQLKGMTPDSSDGREDSEANVTADLERALSGEQSSFGNIKFGEDAFAAGDTYASYGEYQKKKGTADRVNLVQGMYEPLVEGSFSSLDFEALGKQAEQKVTGLPGEAATQAQETAGIFTGGYDKFKERASKKAPGAFKGAMSMVGGLPGALLGGALFGGNSRNAFGNMTASGSGAFKVVSDLLHSRQYADVEANRAAAAANKALGDASGPRGPEGFQMVFGNGMGITRRVGTGAYTGNMQGLSFNQVKTIEALQKGFVPSGYNTVTETGRTLESEGYNSGRLSTGGYYKDNGTFMTPTGVTAQFGMEKDAKALGDKYGISNLNTVKSILQDARNGKGTVSGLMAAEKAKVDKAAADKAAQDARDKAQKVAQDAWKRATQTTGPSMDDGGDTGQGGGSDPASQQDAMESEAYGGGFSGYAAGGQVGMAAGGQMAAGMAPSGFIGAPPSQVSEAESVADNVNTQKEEGTFIINAAAVEFAGESDIMKMLKDAQKEAVRRGITVDNPERSAKLIDVAVSQGEVTVAPYLVKIIGEDRLTKINNRGKPETQERIEENGQQMAAQGGFIGLANGGMANSSENYEDKIIVDEVRRKMEAIFKTAEDRGIDVTSEYPGPEEQKHFEDIARLNPGTQPITGSWDAGLEEMNVPKTPTLFNLFALAEEMAHTEFFDNINKKAEADPDYEAVFEQSEEGRFAEELRAKMIAFETVGGLLPAGKATADMTLNDYASNFVYYLKNNADESVYEAMLKKYPSLKNAKSAVVPMAEGGFLENPQAYALGDKVKVYRGEPLDLEKVNPTDYGYGSDDVGKFHTPDKNRARKFAAGGGRGNQVILSRKVTMDQLFDGVEEAWKVQSKKKTGYFTKMPKKELDKNLKFIKGLRDAYASGERSVDSMVMFLQEQVFDGKSKIDFIETFKNDPLSGGKLLGRAINKVATKAAPPLAILQGAFNATSVADATLGDSFLNSSANPDFTKNKN